MRRYNLLILTLFVSTIGIAQVNSPYSVYGFGDIVPNNVGRNFGMSGVGQAVGSDHFINVVNPAMLANTSPKSLTFFDFGIKNTKYNVTSPTDQQRTSNTNLDYVGLAFPIKAYKPNVLINTWYTGVGISQYSDVEYSVNYSSLVNDSTSVNYANNGFGGFSQAYWTNSFRVADKFYLGIEAAYIFGNIEKTSSSQFIYSGHKDPTITENSELIAASDFKFKPGFAYRFPVKLCRTKKVKTIKCENQFYRTDKEVLEDCANRLKFSSVGITNYDTIRTKHLDTLTGSEKKAAEKLFRQHQEVYKRTKIEACKNNPNLEYDKKNYVHHDSLVDAYTLFYGKDIQRIQENALVGRNITLIKEESRIFIAEKIGDPRQRSAVYNLLKVEKPKGYGIILFKNGEEFLDNAFLLKKEIDSLMNKTSDEKLLLHNKIAKKYLTYTSDIYVTLGGSYELNRSVNTNQLSTIKRVTSNGSLISEDTLLDTKGEITFPSIFNFGIGLEKPAPSGTKPCGERRKSIWALGLDFSMYQFSQYKSTFDDQKLDNSWRVALGGEITPDLLADKNVFFKRAIYRAGLSYQKMPYSLDGNKIFSYGMTFGLSLPMYEPNSSTSYPVYLNLNFEYGKRGYQDGLVENRFVIHASFSISNKWFIRHKEGL